MGKTFSFFLFFFFFCSTGAWTQGLLHLESLHQPFFDVCVCVMDFFKLESLKLFTPVLASNHDPPDLCLLSS
jgi:hypothetical protein